MARIVKDLSLDLADIPGDRQGAAKQEVGEYLVNETIRYMERGLSPVEGEGPWAKLDSEYAKEEHGGNRKPTLNATGRPRESLKFKTDEDGIQIGIMHKTQEGKADGHNNFSGRSRLPRRRFVPGATQNYKAEILQSVDRILNAYRISDIDVSDEPLPIAAQLVFQTAIDRIIRGEVADTEILSIAAIVGEKSLEAFLQRRFG